ncbi:hypothetical protein ACFL6S_32565 [Candidatus Poribacteria bacterium]
MEGFEELFEIGGPIVLEELELDEKTIDPKELPEAFSPKCSEATSVEVSTRGASAENLILPRNVEENASCYCVGYLSRMGITAVPPNGDRGLETNHTGGR